MTENQAGGTTGGMVRDVVVYTLARLVLVAALTGLIFYVAYGMRHSILQKRLAGRS